MVEIQSRCCIERIEKNGINYDLSLFFNEEVQEELKKSANVVEQVLSQQTIARNDDLWLVFLCWVAQRKAVYTDINGHHGYFVPIESFSSLLKPESITRARRMINYEFCKYLPTDPEILRRRKIKEQKYKDFFSNKKQRAGAITEEWW